MLVEQHILHAPSDLQKSRKSSRRMDKIIQEECVQLDIIKYEIAAPLSIQDYTHTAPISISFTPPTDNTHHAVLPPPLVRPCLSCVPGLSLSL